MMTKTDDFSSVFNLRKRQFGQYLLIHHKPNQLNAARFGFVVSKKIAKRAVDRNYMRRVLRELCRAQTDVVASDIIVQVRQLFAHAQFGVVQQEFSQLVRNSQKVAAKAALNTPNTKTNA